MSSDGITRDLPNPFFVVATQNPREQIGTFPLPESQLDRFLMRVNMGFPAPEFEMELLKGNRKTDAEIPALLTPAEVIKIQDKIEGVHCSEIVLKYVQRILAQSRSLKADFAGLSPRSGLALLSAARAWAYLEGRDFVLPEDIQAVGPWVMNHRMKLPTASAYDKTREFFATIAVE